MSLEGDYDDGKDDNIIQSTPFNINLRLPRSVFVREDTGGSCGGWSRSGRTERWGKNLVIPHLVERSRPDGYKRTALTTFSIRKH